MDTRTLTNGYEYHPGYSEANCPLQITVTPSPYGTSARGFACSHTGGHCIPCINCTAWREADLIDALKALETLT